MAAELIVGGMCFYFFFRVFDDFALSLLPGQKFIQNSKSFLLLYSILSGLSLSVAFGNITVNGSGLCEGADFYR